MLGRGGCGAYSMMKALKTGLPRVLDVLQHEGRICFQDFVLEEFCTFFLVSNVFSSNLVISHQKGGQNCCLPRIQKHYDFFTMPLYWLFRVGATCIRAPSAPTAISLYCTVK